MPAPLPATELNLPPFAPELLNEIGSLCEALFGANDIDISWRLTRMPAASVFLMRGEMGLPIAFKAGYASAQGRYYSWLGGVHPDHRRRGLAGELMRQQHRWLVEQGYSLVETLARRENTAMALLNLQHGFVIGGMRTEAESVKVLFSKTLPA